MWVILSRTGVGEERRDGADGVAWFHPRAVITIFEDTIFTDGLDLTAIVFAFRILGDGEGHAVLVELGLFVRPFDTERGSVGPTIGNGPAGWLSGGQIT